MVDGCSPRDGPGWGGLLPRVKMIHWPLSESHQTNFLSKDEIEHSLAEWEEDAGKKTGRAREV